MNNPSYPFHVRAQSGFHLSLEPDFPDKEVNLTVILKQHHIDARRLSKFSKLVMWSALPLSRIVQNDCAIYLAAPFSSPSHYLKIFQKLLSSNLPSPLDFMANLHNAAVFHTAQMLGCSGATVFTASNGADFSQILQLAALDFNMGLKQALVGWACEQPENEGCVWWLLEAGNCDQIPMILPETGTFSEKLARLAQNRDVWAPPVS